MKNVMIFCLVLLGFFVCFFLFGHTNSTFTTRKNRQVTTCISNCAIANEAHPKQIVDEKVKEVLKITSSYLQKYKPAAPVVPIEEQWFTRRWERKNSIASFLSDLVAQLLHKSINLLNISSI